MRIDVNFAFGSGPDLRAAAGRLEGDGYDAAWVSETSCDPFVALSTAAVGSERIALGTGIAVAFARSPMTTAMAAHNLQQLTGGRLLLGLGTQIKPHITRRFSMPWSHPAPRMREYVQAMRAIWAAFEDGAPLDFQGEFYTHTLMTPFFNPGPHGQGTPPVFLAGVGELMTRVAGEVADGFLCHGFTTERYVREVTMPALRAGRETAGHTGDGAMTGFSVCGAPFVVTGRTDDERRAARTAVKGQIAFYGSTPAYRGVLELHGWGELQDELNRMSKQGRWAEMGDVVGDDVLEAFAVVADPDGVADEIARRYGDVWDRLTFYAPWESATETLAPAAQALRSR